MRIAWHGPAPTTEEGVSYVATQLLAGLHDLGFEVDCFLSTEPDQVTDVLRGRKGLRFHCVAPRWEWGKWYSRTPLPAFITGQSARALVQRELVGEIARRHAHRPYDLLYQFSQIELFGVRTRLASLPPIVLHPEVHLAGELACHRREAMLSRRCEPVLRRMSARALLAARATRQRNDVKLARGVIAPSRRFAEHLARDYSIPPGRIQVVPNPIDLDRFSPASPDAATPGCLTLLFVSRMAVRKGVDLVVGLSQRLSDLAGRVRIIAVGERSSFSDYRPLLAGLDRSVADYVGGVAPARLPDVYRSAAALLQPSYYEPFAITVGEALASGLPVVVSDEVGAGEGVDPDCCSVFPAGNLDALELAVRRLVARLEGPERARLATLARAEAERLFAPPLVARRLASCLERVAAPPHSETKVAA